MKVTLFTTDSASIQLLQVTVAHITIFGKNEIALHFIDKEEQLKFITTCIEKYVLIQFQGMKVSLIPETNNFQRVNFRFD